jgi:hypothetical protein
MRRVLSLIWFKEGKRLCIYCNKETEVFIISPIYKCSKCNKLWDHTETFYECTRQGCFTIFSRSESEEIGYHANQCPDCGWPYGRTYTTEACPSCSSSLAICEKGEIILCQECCRWFFVRGSEEK